MRGKYSVDPRLAGLEVGISVIIGEKIVSRPSFPVATGDRKAPKLITYGRKDGVGAYVVTHVEEASVDRVRTEYESKGRVVKGLADGNIDSSGNQ